MLKCVISLPQLVHFYMFLDRITGFPFLTKRLRALRFLLCEFCEFCGKTSLKIPVIHLEAW